MAAKAEPIWHIERLTAAHKREAFSSGEPSLSDFIRRLAGQYDRRDLGRTFVAVQPESHLVHGHYTLSTGGVTFAALPAEVGRRLPRHPIPVVHLGRLAVDQQARGRRLGETLLMDALRRAVSIAEGIGVFAVEVHALHERARNFYLRYGFQSLPDDQHHLFLPMKTIRRLAL